MKFVTVFECGGTERQFLNLGLALDRRGFEVRFGCLHQKGRLLAEIEAHRIPITEYRIRSLYSVGAATRILALARDLARERVDVMHAYNLYGNVFAVPAAKLAGVPVVIAAIRDCGVYLNKWKRYVQRRACALADLILVNASSVKEWLVSDGYDPGHIAVIRNGIDIDGLERGQLRAGDFRRELGVPEGVPLLSMIARLCPSKGIEDAIDAMAVVRMRHPEARLLVVGEALQSRNGELHQDGQYRAILEARARALGLADRIVFLGYRQDVAAILAAVSIAIQPSLTEGLSNSILEAMAAGRAVIATPVGGTPEVIHHERTGLLVPVRQPRALGEAASALLDDPARRQALGTAARTLIHSRFSVTAMVDATERVYRDLLERKRTRPVGQASQSAVSVR